MTEEASEMTKRVYASDNYDKALCIIGEYVNITSSEDMNEDYDEDEDFEEDYDEDFDEDYDEGMAIRR